MYLPGVSVVKVIDNNAFMAVLMSFLCLHEDIFIHEFIFL